MRAPSPDAAGSFEDEVDFGGSEPPSPQPSEREELKSGHSSPTAQSRTVSADIFFPSDAFMASARSFNMFKSMLQLELID